MGYAKLVLAMLAEGFKSLKSVADLWKHRSELKNAPDVRKAVIGKQRQAEIDRIRKAVQDEDIDEIRRDSADPDVSP